MSVGRAILVGILWVNGSALLGLALPIVAALQILSMSEIEQVGDSEFLIGLVLVLTLSFAAAWFAWSVQVPRWRVWAYRHVSDIEALKASAVSAGLIWPEGHFFQRTEFRTAAQSDELARLERAGAMRAIAFVASEKADQAPTRIGTAFKALVFGLICTPVCMLAPAGFLSWVGIEITGHPIYWILVAAFPVLLALHIYRRARRDAGASRRCDPP